MNLSNEIFKISFAFYAQASALDSVFEGKINSLSDVEKFTILNIVQEILSASEMENPHMDLFVDAVLRLRFLVKRLGPKNFHPALVKTLFDATRNEMWSHFRNLKQQKVNFSERDARMMRVLSWELHEMLENDLIFKESLAEEFIVENEGFKE